MVHQREELAQKIRVVAEELQIDAIGFVPLDRVDPRVVAEYQQWLREGKHAGMQYLAEYQALRADPRGLLEGAQSVIVIAISYYPTLLQAPHAPQIAKYALGRDYHKVLRKLLQQLGEAIGERVAPHQYRALVDTAPFFERYWAEQSGIGFVGKNGNLIIPGMGSFLFLGELLTTLPLPAASPMPFRCGNCTRCLQACPTGALSAMAARGKTDGPTPLDARRCINYLTIEHRGEIPENLARKIGSRLYGCDTCQDVCPFNHAPRPTRHFTPPPQLLHLTAEELMPFTEETYARLFYGTAATRAKYEGMARNVRLYLQSQSH